MADNSPTIYMNLPNPIPGASLGPQYALDLQASLILVDQHNHSSGNGQQIQPNGINISSDLTFNSNNAIAVRSLRFTPQTSPIPNSGLDLGSLYVSGNELYYNDVSGGHQVQITTNGSINATSSGISSGTATAAFTAGTLVVKSNSTSGANIEMQSAILTNNSNLTNTLTLQAPTLSSSTILTLPAVPLNLSFMTMDAIGNMGTVALTGALTHFNLSNSAGILGTQLSATAGILGTQLSATAGIVDSQLVSLATTKLTGTITGSQIASNVNLVGTPTASNLNIVTSRANNANGQTTISRGLIAADGSILYGEGITSVVNNSAGVYTVTFTTFFDSPAITVTPNIVGGGLNFCSVQPISQNVVKVLVYNTSFIQVNQSFSIILIGVI